MNVYGECYQVVFMSTEDSLGRYVLNCIFQKNLIGLLVDEAHCMQEMVPRSY